MANLTKAIISGSLTALRTVRQYLSNPAIIYQPQTQAGLPLPSQVVVMQVSEYHELLANQVSKMLLVDVSQGKSFLSDNVAPQPRVWQITGFLFPLVPFIPDTDQIQLEALKDTLRSASDSRQLVQFKPISTSILSQFADAFTTIANQSVTGTVPVVIVDIDFWLDPTIQNKAPFKMTLMKIDQLSSFLVSGPTVSQTPDGNLSNPYASSASNSLGNTVNTQTSPAVAQ